MENLDLRPNDLTRERLENHAERRETPPRLLDGGRAMTFWCENFDKGEKPCKATF
jgi:hypothetical protein